MSQGQILAEKRASKYKSTLCQELIQFYASRYVEENFEYGFPRKTIPFYTESGRVLDKTPPHQSVLPQFDVTRRLMVVLTSDGHVYFIYKNHRIDSDGKTGGKVTSVLKPNHAVIGDLGFLIHSLSDDQIHHLDDWVENFQTKSQTTCSSLACTYLNSFFPKIVSSDSVFTSQLVKQMIDAKLKGEPIAIVRLSDLSPAQTLRAIQFRQVTSFLPSLFIYLRGR